VAFTPTEAGAGSADQPRRTDDPVFERPTIARGPGVGNPSRRSGGGAAGAHGRAATLDGPDAGR